jgi:hypothetical protein
MKEQIEFPFSLETEMKLARQQEQTGIERDELIARALDIFLRSLGL